MKTKIQNKKRICFNPECPKNKERIEEYKKKQEQTNSEN
jgi:hypothetical protein